MKLSLISNAILQFSHTAGRDIQGRKIHWVSLRGDTLGIMVKAWSTVPGKSGFKLVCRVILATLLLVTANLVWARDLQRSLAASVLFDSSFGSAGVINYWTGGQAFNDSYIHAALQSNQKIVVANRAEFAGSRQSSRLLRFNVDGTLDQTFGENGEFSFSDRSVGLFAILPNDKILALASSTRDPGTGQITTWITRLNANGTIDLSFGTNGLAQIYQTQSFSEILSLQDLTIQVDGKVVITGHLRQTLSEGSNDYLVMRINTDGTLDTTFNDDGIGTYSVGASEYGHGVAVMSTGEIVVVGYTIFTATYCDPIVIKLTSSGLLDSSFGTGGVRHIVGNKQYGCEMFLDVVIQSDDKIVAVGISDRAASDAIGVYRFNSDGTLDNSFGTGGEVLTQVLDPWAYSVVIDVQGRIVVAGSGKNSSCTNRGAYKCEDTLVVRYRSDGSIDEYNGIPILLMLAATAGDNQDGAQEILLQNDGKILLFAHIVPAGKSGFDLAIVRLNESIIDPSTVPPTTVPTSTTTTSTTVPTSTTTTSTTTSTTVPTSTTTTSTTTSTTVPPTTTTSTTVPPTTTTSTTVPPTTTTSTTVPPSTTTSTTTSTTVPPTRPSGETGLSINRGSSYTNTRDVSLRIVWPSGASTVRISNDGGFAADTTSVFSLNEFQDWKLDASTPGLNTKIVYVRFGGSGFNTSLSYSDDILLDVDVPVVASATAEQVGAYIVLTLTATDGESGLSKIEVNNGSKTVDVDFAASVLVKASDVGLGASASSLRKMALGSLKIRVSDKAGNKSSWTSLGTTVAPVVTTTVAPVNAPAVASLLVPALTSPKLTASKSASAKSIATFAKLKVLSTSKVKLKVVASSAKFCRVSGTTLNGLKAGSCKVTVTVTPKKGRATSKTVTLKVTK